MIGNCAGDCLPICDIDINTSCKCGDLSNPCDQSTNMCLVD